MGEVSLNPAPITTAAKSEGSARAQAKFDLDNGKLTLTDGRCFQVNLTQSTQLPSYVLLDLLTILAAHEELHDLLDCIQSVEYGGQTLDIKLGEDAGRKKITVPLNAADQELRSRVRSAAGNLIGAPRSTPLLKGLRIDLNLHSLNPQEESAFTSPTLELSSIVSSPSSYSTTTVRSDVQERVETWAADYGYKSANLMELQEVVQSIGANVPPFLALSHQQMQTHLQTHYPSFADDWKAVCEAQRSKSHLTTEAEEMLAKIRANIQRAFKEHPYVSKETEQFLSTVPGTLMVRSTGREDTREQANAGGNESIAGVTPSGEDVSAAIGTVLASYFSEKSLGQRLSAGDDILQEPFMPVLLQHMIGEQPGASGGEIPVSGVAYTVEMAGKTKDLTVINAVIGHNEAVVNNSLSHDTYYVYPEGLSHIINVNKPVRYVADMAKNGESRFRIAKNNAEQSSAPSLGTEETSRIEALSQRLHQHYGGATDIEWVLMGGKLYVVQARPLKETAAVTPSTVDPKKLLNATRIDGETIVHNKGKAAVISQSKEIIAARTLDEALYTFLDREKKRRDAGDTRDASPVKAVIVQQPAAPLSHAACVFRERGVVAMQTAAPFDDQQFTDGKCLVIVDPQQGALFQQTGARQASVDAASVETALIEQGALKEGWFAHPIPARESMQTVPYTSEEEILEVYKQLTTGAQIPLSELRKKPIAEIFKQMASDNLDDSDQAIRELFLLLFKGTQALKEANPALYSRAKILLQNAARIGSDALKRKEHMQRLHAVNRLKALVYQDFSLRLLDTDSFRLVLQEQNARASIRIPPSAASSTESARLRTYEARLLRGVPSEMQAKLKRRMTDEEVKEALYAYKTFGNLALNAEAKETWNQFSEGIATTRSLVAHKVLFALIKQVHEADIAGEWMNSIFVEAMQGKSPIEALEVLTDQLRSGDTLLASTKELQGKLDTWESILSQWEDPNAFEENWKRFSEEIATPLIQQLHTYRQLPENTSPIVRLILYKQILRGVDLYDRSIKVHRSSTQYDATAKPLQVRRFRTMLAPYHLLSETAVSAIPTETLVHWTRNFTDKVSDPNDYRKAVQERIRAAFESVSDDSERHLLPSSDFSVQKSCINSGAYFDEKSLPNAPTLEDVFMLAHQNALAGIATIRTGFDSKHLPADLQKAMEELASIDVADSYGKLSLHYTANLLSIDYQYPKITVSYNLPIKYHSSQLTLTHDVRQNSSRFEFNVLGHNLANRMEVIGAKLLMNSLARKVPLDTVPYYSEAAQTLTCAWKPNLSSPKPLSACISLMMESIDDTLSGNFGFVNIPGPEALVKENPDLVKEIIETPGLFRHLSSIPNEYTAKRLLNYLIQKEDWESARGLMRDIGIQLSPADSEEAFTVQLLKALREQPLKHTKGSLLIDLLSIDLEKQTAAKIADKHLELLEISDEMPEEVQETLRDVAYSAFYFGVENDLPLCEKLLSHSANRGNMEALTYFVLSTESAFKRLPQPEPIIEHRYVHSTEDSGYDSEEDVVLEKVVVGYKELPRDISKKRAGLQKLLDLYLPGLQAARTLGVPASESVLKGAQKVTELDALQPGQTVIVNLSPNRVRVNPRWVFGEVLSIGEQYGSPCAKISIGKENFRNIPSESLDSVRTYTDPSEHQS